MSARVTFVECDGSFVNVERILSFRAAESHVNRPHSVVVYDTWGQSHSFTGDINEFQSRLDGIAEVIS